jgi:hypothetical protein
MPVFDSVCKPSLTQITNTLVIKKNLYLKTESIVTDEKNRRWSKQELITYGKLPNQKYMINRIN